MIYHIFHTVHVTSIIKIFEIGLEFRLLKPTYRDGLHIFGIQLGKSFAGVAEEILGIHPKLQANRLYEEILDHRILGKRYYPISRGRFCWFEQTFA